MTARYKSVLSAWSMVFGAALLVASVATAGGPPPPPPCTTTCPFGPAGPANCNRMDTPTITCVSSTPTSITIRVCAGATGAPGGISIHWMKLSDYVAAGNSFSGSFGISLSGNCGGPNAEAPWSLAPNQCKNITFDAGTLIRAAAEGCGSSGDAADLVCDTDYVFEIFAHNDPGPNGKDRSCFSAPLICRTAACPVGDCTLSWGYWKTHGPAGCNPPGKENLWPVPSLDIGGLTLGQSALCTILGTNPGACAKAGSSNGGANAVIILEHQLIAAMFNKANGAIDCAYANAAIAQANNLLTGFENACVGTSTPQGQQMVEVAGVLGSYNSDQCACLVPSSKPSAAPAAPSNSKRSSWGNVKSIYR